MFIQSAKTSAKRVRPSMNNLSKYKKPILITVAVFVVLLVLAPFILLIRENTNPATLEFDIVPESAIILLDGKQITLGEEKLLKTSAGNHSIAIIKDGYFAEGEEFYIATDETRTIKHRLIPYTQNTE